MTDPDTTDQYRYQVDTTTAVESEDSAPPTAPFAAFVGGARLPKPAGLRLLAKAVSAHACVECGAPAVALITIDEIDDDGDAVNRHQYAFCSEHAPTELKY